MSLIDIIILPVKNASGHVLSLYDQLNKQRQELLSIFVIDNGSTDGLSHQSIFNIDFFTSVKKTIKATAALVHHAILSNDDPSEYFLFLQPNSNIHEDYIQNLVDYIDWYNPDIAFGAVDTRLKRQTKSTPDPRTKSYNKMVKTEVKKKLEEEEKVAIDVDLDVDLDAEQDSPTFTKISGNRTSIRENEEKIESGTAEVEVKYVDPSTIKTEKWEWGGIDLNINYNKEVREKQDSIEKQSGSDNSRLVEPSNSKPKTRSQKYFFQQGTKKWTSNFVLNNILIKKTILLDSDAFGKDGVILDTFLSFLYEKLELLQIQPHFATEWCVFVHSDRIDTKYNVGKIVDKIRAVYATVSKSIHDANGALDIGTAKTDTETPETSERLSSGIIPDLPRHALQRSAATRISSSLIDLSKKDRRLRLLDVEHSLTDIVISTVMGGVSVYEGKFKFNIEKGSKDGPKWFSWME
jgi:glycosyltransferase involved in cell wall biosynthesis